MPRAPLHRLVVLGLSVTLGSCPPEDSLPSEAQLRPEGPPDLLAVLLTYEDGHEAAAYCRYIGGTLDPQAPGVVEVAGVDTTVCPQREADFDPAEASSGWGIRLMFDELLDADRVETLDCDLDDDGSPDEPLVCVGSIETTQPVTIRCGPEGTEVRYGGYYVPNGNKESFPVGPSIVVTPHRDDLVFPTGTDCEIHLGDTVVDESGEHVDPAQADIPFRLADLQVIETQPADGVLERDGAVAFVFNGRLLDEDVFDPSDAVELVDDEGRPIEADVAVGRIHDEDDSLLCRPVDWRPGSYVARIKPGSVIHERNGGTFTPTDAVEVPFEIAPPEPGSAIPCDDGHRVTPVGLGAAVAVCIDARDVCTLHDPSADELECATAIRAADVRLLDPPNPAGACSGTPASAAAWGWRFVWSSRGSFYGCMRSGPADAEHWIVVERPEGGPRWQVRFRVAGGVVEVLGAALFTGTFHPFGAHVHCEGAPVTFGEPTNLDGRWAEVCVGSAASGACSLFGDTRLTSEDEGAAGCDQPPPLELWVTAANGPYAFSGPSASHWTIVSTTHGTLSNDNLVKDFPSDTDVTVVSAATDRSESWRIVFRYGTAGFTIVSVTRV